MTFKVIGRIMPGLSSSLEALIATRSSASGCNARPERAMNCCRRDREAPDLIPVFPLMEER